MKELKNDFFFLVTMLKKTEKEEENPLEGKLSP